MSTFSHFTRNLILGNQEAPGEISGSKMTLLRGQFALLAMFLGVLYAIIVGSRGEFQYLPWHLLLVSGGAFAFYLNRKGKHIISTITLFLLTNAFVYLFTAVNRPQDGMFFYYFITNTLSIILIGYRHYFLILVLVLITLALAIVAYLYPASPIPLPTITPGVEKTIFLINLIVSILFGSYVIVSLMRENNLVETKLIKNHTELIKTNEELDRFVYSASHDMRAPLSSLLGLINVAEKTETPEETLMCLNMMRERVSVMEGFLKEITDYSRNTRTEVEQKPVNVYNAVIATLNNLKFLYERDKIDITVAIAPETTISTDEPRFKVVLNNLISNAIKYFDPAKEKPHILIHTTQSDGWFYFSVEDNGLGIIQEHQKHVFDMFYRATTSGEGSGLGLYIVHETMEKLGGKISLSSKEGKGSTFTVQLPLK